MKTNIIENGRSSEVFGIAVSIALHVAVIAGLAGATWSTVSGRQGIITVFLSDNGEGQVSRESMTKTGPAERAVRRNEPRHHIAPLRNEEEPAVDTPETLAETTYDEHAEVDRQITDHTSVEVHPDASGEVETDLAEERGDGISSSSGPDGGHAISDDGFYIGAFGTGNGPRFVKRVQPLYPLFARRAGKEGRVILELSIDEEGKLIEIEVIESAGNGFDASAVRAVSRSSFSPAVVNGSPISSRTKLPVRFVLTDR